jgi:formylglycine-generating enzyme required for sulfatase activity
MADAFISYKNEDRAAARLFADALAAEGISVWWDPAVRTGETYDEVIERNLREARTVVVLWSPRSVRSKWVRAEATVGDRKGEGGLAPVMIAECERPIAFELMQTADLRGWEGDRTDPRWLAFVADLREALETRKSAARTRGPQQDVLAIETLFWASIKDSGDPADFESYLQRYPQGNFVDLARSKVATVRSPFAPLFSWVELAKRRSPRLTQLLFSPVGGIAIFAIVAVLAIVAWPREQVSSASDGPGDFELFWDCDNCPDMVALPSGTYLIGSPITEFGREPDEGPQRRVTVQRFAIGRFAITFDQWDACVRGGGCTSNPTPSDEGWGRGTRPVINVTWHDAQEYVRWLSEHSGQAYRLPSEAEWEFAARAGTTGRFSWGDVDPVCDAQATSGANFWGCRNRTEPVGAYRANPAGLHEVHGNVWQWVQDCYSDSYAALPSDGTAYELPDCTHRVDRGGGLSSTREHIRSAMRGSYAADRRNDHLGFRIARSL